MKEKRYIKRNPYSIEDSIKDIIEKIGDKGLREATGKGKDTFLKKSNPEHPGRHIDLKARSFKSTTRFQVILLGSILSLFPQ